MPGTPDRQERGKRLAEAREAKGLRQEDLVKLSGVDRSTLSQLENGHRGITHEKALLIAPHVDMQPEDLLDVASPSLLRRLEAIEALAVRLLHTDDDRISARNAITSSLQDVAGRLEALEQTVARLPLPDEQASQGDGK